MGLLGDLTYYLHFSVGNCVSQLASKKKNILLFEIYSKTILEDNERDRDEEFD